jgi:hypothetical protein
MSKMAVRSFEQLLKNGADAGQIVDLASKSSTFELLCKDPEANDLIIKCLEYNTDPNKVSFLEK